MTKMLTMMCATAVAAVALGEDITITLTADADIASALATQGATVAELNGGAKKAYNVNLVGPSTGYHTIVFDKPMTNWTGNLNVGARVNVSTTLTSADSKYLLGAEKTGIATIASGASLYVDGSACTADWKLRRPVHIIGTGVDADEGAIRMVPGSSGQQIRHAIPYTLVLDGDATIVSDASNSSLVHEGGSIDFQYHNLTFRTPAKYANKFSYYYVGTFKNCTGSQIIFDRAVMMSRSNYYPGDKTTQLIFRNGGYFSFNDTGASREKTVTKGGPWTLVFEEASQIETVDKNYACYPDVNVWPGPMRFDDTVSLRYGNSSTNSVSLQGSISGAGGLKVSGISSSGPYARQLYLAGTNTFTGSLAVTDAALMLMSDRAIPPENDNIALTNAAVMLYNGRDESRYEYDLNRIAFAGQTQIDAQNSFYARAKAERLTIRENATLAIAPKTFDAGALIVEKGATVAFGEPVEAATVRKQICGLWYGQHEYVCTNEVKVTSAVTNIITSADQLPATDRVLKFDWDAKMNSYCNARIEDDKVWGKDSTLPVTNVVVTAFSIGTHSGYMFPDSVMANPPLDRLYTNSVVSVPHIFDCKPSNWEALYSAQTNAYKTYSGYIWNDGDTDQKWDFAFTALVNMYVTIGDDTFVIESKYGDHQTRQAKFHTFTLKPGANKFTIRCGNMFVSSGNYGHVLTNNMTHVTSEKLRYGVLVNRNGGTGTVSTDMNDYEGIGALDAERPLFSRYASVAEVKAADARMTFEYRADTLSGAGTVDLNGGTLKVRTVDLSGGLKVVNGTVENTEPIVIVDDSRALDAPFVTGTVKVNVTQDAAKRRANLKGLWSGIVKAQDSDKTKEHYTNKLYDNALEDASADFYGRYYTDSVVTVMAPMTHVTSWPSEGSEYASLWLNAATDYFWYEDHQRYKTWSGCVWNPSSTSETWTVVNCNNAYVDVLLNGTHCYKNWVSDNRSYGTYSGQNGYSRNTYTAMSGKFGSGAQVAQITVAPGANELKVRYYNRWNTCAFWPGSTETNYNGQAFANWSEGHGLAFDRKGRGTYDLNDFEDFADTTGQMLTREMPEAFPYLRCAAPSVDFNGNETATGMLIGELRATNGALVVDGNWNLTKAEIEDETIVSTGLKFNESSRLVITDATLQQILSDMNAAGKNGYVLATGVSGAVKPMLVHAEKDKGLRLFLSGGVLTLAPGRGMVVILR